MLQSVRYSEQSHLPETAAAFACEDQVVEQADIESTSDIGKPPRRRLVRRAGRRIAARMIMRHHQRPRAQRDRFADDLAQGQRDARCIPVRPRRQAKNPTVHIEMSDTQLLMSQVAEAGS